MIPNVCPICGANWDAGDILEVLSGMPYYANHTAQQLLESAANYGWTSENRKQFSRCISIYDQSLDRTVGWQCPDCGVVQKTENQDG